MRIQLARFYREVKGGSDFFKITSLPPYPFGKRSPYDQICNRITRFVNVFWGNSNRTHYLTSNGSYS